MWVRSLGQEDPLEEGMATHSSTLAWRIPWTESLAGYSPWGGKESDMTEMTGQTHMHRVLLQKTYVTSEQTFCATTEILPL